MQVCRCLLHNPAELDLDEGRPRDYDFRCFFLHRPRAQLYARIDQRVEQMVQAGLLQVRKGGGGGGFYIPGIGFLGQGGAS